MVAILWSFSGIYWPVYFLFLRPVNQFINLLWIEWLGVVDLMAEDFYISSLLMSCQISTCQNCPSSVNCLSRKLIVLCFVQKPLQRNPSILGASLHSLPVLFRKSSCVRYLEVLYLNFLELFQHLRSYIKVFHLFELPCVVWNM